MGIKFDYGKSTLNRKLGNMGEKIGAAVLMYSSTKASELKYKMKQNRPWTDRTGAAKALLDARVSRPKPNIIRITLSHGVDYGIWLELAHEKNYAIIAPTVREESPKVVEDLNNIMSNIKL